MAAYSKDKTEKFTLRLSETEATLLKTWSETSKKTLSELLRSSAVRLATGSLIVDLKDDTALYVQTLAGLNGVSPTAIIERAIENALGNKKAAL